MALSQEAILERLKNKSSLPVVETAVFHEDRVRFCTKKYFDSSKPSYLNTHLARVKAKLPADKYNNYASELSFPLPINPVADVVFSELYKVWDTDSRTIEPNFNKPGLKPDFDEFLQETNFLRFFQKDGWEAYKTQPNCILTIDMPAEQLGYYPSPYINIVDISSVKHIVVGKQGDINELVYMVNELTAVGIDEDNYWLFSREATDQPFAVTATTPHGLYWCPAIFLIQDSLDSSNKLLKESPVTKCLYDFEKLLFRQVSGENLEDYAGYPIHLMRDDECDYEDGNGQKCNGGVVPIADTIGHYNCPRCNGSNLNGAGSAYKLQPDAEGKFDFDNAVKLISADVDSLDYKDKSIETRKQTIIAACSGASEKAMAGQAQNELQISAIFQSREALIQKVQDNLESAIKFCLDTIGTLRYGEVYTGSVVNLGTNHYLVTDNEIQDKIIKAVGSNAPQYQLGLLWDELNQTQFKANPRMQQRAAILKRLEPAPYADLDQSKIIFRENEILLYLKYNIVNLVAEFEDINGDIVDFGSLLSPAQKIKVIQQELINYVKDKFKQFEAADIRQPGRGQGVSDNAA